ncbi:hypothetical protein CGSSp9BS68_05898 [Streptococcus pneumoniae SP9-BS68]|nr:hypothetical protein CGSSp11BS70_00555 [Streptococcus pneumoniae SP11-BS70]EDK78499.1 hypothetical protein CGSSp9BS68_05898 [Streptococcus pneumoniae SP9-BS68]
MKIDKKTNVFLGNIFLKDKILKYAIRKENV